MGSSAGLSGADLANRGYLQALKFRAELVAPVEVRSMTCEVKMHRLVLDNGQVVRGRTVLIATRPTYQRLPVASCERWDGAGIFYSCTSVHARSCMNAQAAVVGGSNSAGQAAMFLTGHNAGATLLLRGVDVRKCMSDYLAREIERHEKFEVIRHVEVDAAEGEGTLNGAPPPRSPGSRFPRPRLLGGVRLHRRVAPYRLAAPSIAVDPKCFILTQADAAKSDRRPLPDCKLCVDETSCPGVFAAGCVRSKTTKRVAFADGDEALAVSRSHRVLAEL